MKPQILTLAVCILFVYVCCFPLINMKLQGLYWYLLYCDSREQNILNFVEATSY